MAFTPLRRQQMQIPMGEVINWADPLANGIVGYVVPGRNGFGATEVVGTVKTASGGGGKGYAFGSTLAGGTDGYVSLGNVTTAGYGPSKRRIRSLFFHVLYAGTGGNGLGRMLDSTDTLRAELFYMSDGQVLVYQFISSTTGSTINYVIGASVPFGERKLGATIDHETGIWTGYIDGTKQTPVDTGATTRAAYSPSSSAKMVTGNRPSDVARTFDGVVYLGLVYDRLLTDQDHAQLAANPARVLI